MTGCINNFMDNTTTTMSLMVNDKLLMINF